MVTLEVVLLQNTIDIIALVVLVGLYFLDCHFLQGLGEYSISLYIRW